MCVACTLRKCNLIDDVVAQTRAGRDLDLQLLGAFFDAKVINADLPADSMQALQDNQVDLVLINRKLDADYSDGMDILKAIKADAALAEIPVMLVSKRSAATPCPSWSPTTRSQSTKLPKGVVSVTDSSSSKTRLPLFSRGSWSEADRVAKILRKETVGGALLLVATLVALIWANSPWSAAYDSLMSTRVGPSALHLDEALSALDEPLRDRLRLDPSRLRCRRNDRTATITTTINRPPLTSSPDFIYRNPSVLKDDQPPAAAP